MCVCVRLPWGLGIALLLLLFDFNPARGQLYGIFSMILCSRCHQQVHYIHVCSCERYTRAAVGSYVVVCVDVFWHHKYVYEHTNNTHRVCDACRLHSDGKHRWCAVAARHNRITAGKLLFVDKPGDFFVLFCDSMRLDATRAFACGFPYNLYLVFYKTHTDNHRCAVYAKTTIQIYVQFPDYCSKPNEICNVHAGTCLSPARAQCKTLWPLYHGDCHTYHAHNFAAKIPSSCRRLHQRDGIETCSKTRHQF